MAKRTNIDIVREAAEADLYTFATLVCHNRLYGDIHRDVFRWLQIAEHPNQLLLLPRAHMKSHCIAVWCAWWITKHPETTILYISATSTLAEQQLYAIKNILVSAKYKKYWPDMIRADEGKRERWTTGAISVDHPLRKAEGVRDSTIVSAGLTTNTVGLHADVIIADDVVVPDNAYTEDGRRKCSSAMSLMASILNTGGIIKACGTRYHPADQYQTWKSQRMVTFDDEGEVSGQEPIWEIKEHVVEEDNIFLWPREMRTDGKAFGFDQRELARIKALYTDQTQFFAQYYNDPNDPSSDRIGRDRFQYYDPKHLKCIGGQWCFKERPLNIYASIDFAFTISKKADYTAIVVIGVDSEGFIYLLDIDRFRSDKIAGIFDRIVPLHEKWNFNKLRAEVNAAQGMIARDLKDRIRQEGMRLSIDESRPTRHGGKKEERIAAILEPRYENQTIYHYRGGYVGILEEELILSRPAHDDIKDALASVVEIARAPRAIRGTSKKPNVIYHNKWGGVAFR
jgi:phage terminase large subunit-like protein